MSEFDSKALADHEAFQWKVAVHSKVPLDSKDDLSTYYTPWVAAPCREIAQDASLAYKYTWKSNSVAVVSDGTSVLGLWNIGWVAWLPVMEWKAILMKAFADIDAVPIVLSTQDPDEIIKTVEHISPTFGAINLEDIKAPECFYIEEELNKRLPIPVFHDDQHGTAIVVLAWLINACRVLERNIQTLVVTISWAWAAWIAIANLLAEYGVQTIRIVDSKGMLYEWREYMNTYKQSVVRFNTGNIQWNLRDALSWSDVFIWVSRPNIVSQDDIRQMNENPIVFALSNPDPEITRDEALAWWASIYASWRSDIPNQINNISAFPWVLRWALDARIQDITMDHKLAAAKSLAAYVDTPSDVKLLPNPLDKRVAGVVAQTICNV